MLTISCAIALFSSSVYAKSSRSVSNTTSKLTGKQKDRLYFIYQEEKVARDVYIYANEKWPYENTFASIKHSEQRHIDAAEKVCINYGIDLSAVNESTYGEFDDENNYISVLLFYRDNVVFYSHIDQFNTEWLMILNQHKYHYFSGRKTLMDLINPHLDNFEYKKMYFSEAKKLITDTLKNNLLIKKLQTREDAGLIYDLLQNITEFGISNQTKEYFIEGKMKSIDMGVTYFIEEGGIAISTVATTAETTINAIIIGVATCVTARRRGLASILMAHLMKEYFAKGKYLCLFYDNPEAGTIYKRLGFVDTEMWVMLNKR